MSDRDTPQNMIDTSNAAKRLNEKSQPLGYAVTLAAGGTLGDDVAPDYQRFTVHRMDMPVGSGPSFDSEQAAAAHLDELAQLPFDNTELTVRDKATGETFCLKGWSWGVTGSADASQTAGSYEGATHLSVRSTEHPAVGHWYKSQAS